jgi:hypothetical protein
MNLHVNLKLDNLHNILFNFKLHVKDDFIRFDNENIEYLLNFNFQTNKYKNVDLLSDEYEYVYVKDSAGQLFLIDFSIFIDYPKHRVLNQISLFPLMKMDGTIIVEGFTEKEIESCMIISLFSRFNIKRQRWNNCINATNNIKKLKKGIKVIENALKLIASIKILNNHLLSKNNLLYDILCYKFSETTGEMYYDKYVSFELYETNPYYDDLKKIVLDKYGISDLLEYLKQLPK